MQCRDCILDVAAVMISSNYDIPEIIEVSGVITILYRLRERRITQTKHHSSLHSISVLHLAGFVLKPQPRHQISSFRFFLIFSQLRLIDVNCCS